MGENDKKAPVYANAITVSSTLYDFSLSFKLENIYEVLPGKQERDDEEVALVRISPQMAKGLAELLAHNVENYEKQFGPIPPVPVE